MGFLNGYRVELINKPDQPIFGIRDTIKIEDLEELIEQLGILIESNKVEPLGPFMVVYHSRDFNPEASDIQVCVPVSDKFSNLQGYSTQSQGLYACVTHKGGYKKIGAAYGEIFKWINTNGYKIVGSPYEMYLVGPDNSENEKSYRTQICFPIEK